MPTELLACHLWLRLVGGHQARTTVDDPEHGPRLSHLGWALVTSRGPGSLEPCEAPLCLDRTTNLSFQLPQGPNVPGPPQVGS